MRKIPRWIVLLLVLNWLAVPALSAQEGGSSDKNIPTPKEDKEEPIKKINIPEEIIKLLESTQIIEGDERSKLDGLFDQLNGFPLAHDEVQTLAKSISWKLERDRDHLRIIIERLESLSNNGYVKRIGHIQASEVKDLKDDYDLFMERMTNIGGDMGKIKLPIPTGVYLKFIGRYKMVLIGSREGVFRIWTDLRLKMQKYYPIWNKRYQKINGEAEVEAGTPFDKRILTFDEKEFMDAFRELQMTLRKISAQASDSEF